jgi:hypothetical protein
MLAHSLSSEESGKTGKLKSGVTDRQATAFFFFFQYYSNNFSVRITFFNDSAEFRNTLENYILKNDIFCSLC